MDSSTGSEICVFHQICNATRSPPGPAISTGNNFYLEIDILAKHSYTCGDKIVEECHFDTGWGYKYNSLSWDIVDRQLSASNFPYPLEKLKWDGADKILKTKDDLIQQILEFVCTIENGMPPFQDDDTVYVSLIFIKHVFVSPQKYELTQRKIFTKHYERIEKVLWGIVREEINGLGCGSSLYEEFQGLEGYVEKIVRETANWKTMYFDENYDRILIESLIKLAKREFRLLPAVRSRMQFLRAVHFPENDMIDDCSICMSGYLPGSEAYNLPCSHSFHFSCIETWLLKNPSCPMCRFKLPPAE